MKNKLLKIADFFREREYLKVLLVFIVFFFLFSLAYFSSVNLSSGDDHFFHFRFAENMREIGFLDSFNEFQSIFLSKMSQSGEYFVYYNFLFYLILIPFTYLQPLFLGIKLYAVLIAALSFSILYWCCLRLRINYPLAWVATIFALTNSGAIWRLFLSRPYALAPALLILLLIFLHQRKPWAVFGITIFYFFWHSATFFFPFGITILYLFIQKFYHQPTPWRLFFASGFGLLVSLVTVYIISPGFLIYMKEIIFGVIIETIIGKKIILSEGMELYPVDFFDFLRVHALIISGLVISIGIEIYQYLVYRLRRIAESDYFSSSITGRPLQTTLFVLTIASWLGTTAVSGRFGDFFMFFAALYLVISLESVRRYISVNSFAVRRGIVVGLTLMVLYLFGGNILFLRQSLAIGANVNEFSRVGEWLHMNTKPASVIFNPNWSWFPQLYYHSPNSFYLTGLEPRFTYIYNPRLYWLWSNLSTRGQVCEQEKCDDRVSEQQAAFRREETRNIWVKEESQVAAKIMRNDLKSSYVVTSNSYPLLNLLLTQEENFKRVYSDEYYAIFEIL